MRTKFDGRSLATGDGAPSGDRAAMPLERHQSGSHHHLKPAPNERVFLWEPDEFLKSYYKAGESLFGTGWKRCPT
jgi:hypothetical protein